MNPDEFQEVVDAAFERGYTQAVHEVTIAPGLALWAGLALGFSLGVIVMALFSVAV